MHKIFLFKTEKRHPSEPKTHMREQNKGGIMAQKFTLQKLNFGIYWKAAMTILQALQIHALFLQLLEVTQFGTAYNSSCIPSALHFSRSRILQSRHRK